MQQPHWICSAKGVLCLFWWPLQCKQDGILLQTILLQTRSCSFSGIWCGNWKPHQLQVHCCSSCGEKALLDRSILGIKPMRFYIPRWSRRMHSKYHIHVDTLGAEDSIHYCGTAGSGKHNGSNADKRWRHQILSWYAGLWALSFMQRADPNHLANLQCRKAKAAQWNAGMFKGKKLIDNEVRLHWQMTLWH